MIGKDTCRQDVVHQADILLEQQKLVSLHVGNDISDQVDMLLEQ